MTATCSNCHTAAVYRGLPTTCLSCHQAAYQQAQNPNHAAAGFPTACDTCHKLSDPTWHQGTFNHSASFALAGVHVTTACATCHKNSVFKGTPRDCVGCHQADFQNSKNPPHVTAGFSTSCDTCHKFSDATWQQGTFTTHAAVFPLAGAHLTAPCAQCHVNNNYTTVPKSPCSACHMTDFQNATTPVPHTGFSDRLRLLPQVLRHDVVPEVRASTTRLLRPRRRSHHGAVRPVPQEQQLPDRADQPLLRLPPGGLPDGHRAGEPRRFRLPDDVRLLPQVLGYDLEPGDLRALDVCVGGPPRHAGLRELSQEQRLQGDAAGLLHLPPDRLPERGHAGPAQRLPDRLRLVPPVHRHDVGAEVRFQPHALLRPRRRSHHGAVRPVPQEQQLSDRAHQPLFRLPPRRLPDGDHAVEPRRFRLPDDLRLLPQVLRYHLVAGDVQSHHGLPAGRRSRHGAVRPVSQEQRLQGDAAGLLHLPPDRLPDGDDPGPPQGFPTRATHATGSPT